MTIGGRCGSCDRELLLVQLAQPIRGFRCLFCGFACAPGYATVAPGVATRVMAAQATLVTALTELASMTGDRLRLDRATLVDPVANTLPAIDAEAKEPTPARRRRAHWRPAPLPHRSQPPRRIESSPSPNRPARRSSSKASCRRSLDLAARRSCHPRSPADQPKHSPRHSTWPPGCRGRGRQAGPWPDLDSGRHRAGHRHYRRARSSSRPEGWARVRLPGARPVGPAFRPGRSPAPGR
jgi:hypothetical protein